MIGPSRAVRRALLAVLIVLFVAGAIYLWRTGGVTAGGMRRWIDSLGPAGPVLFVLAFVAGGLIGLPGMAFVLGAGLAFGPVTGGALAYVGGMCSVTLPFAVARWLRRASVEPWQPKGRLADAMGLIQRHPLRAVVVLRLVLWFNPPLSYALALSGIRFRDYIVGAGLALALVVASAMAVVNWLW